MPRVRGRPPAADPDLAEALDRYARVVVDVGCGDGRFTLRLAARDPEALVIGLDAETGRLGRAMAMARRRRIGNLRFLTWSMERPLDVLEARADELQVVMPWGSLLDGVLGADTEVLDNLLRMGKPGARLRAVVNCRPWDAPASVDDKLASTPEPTPEMLDELRRRYAARGWRMSEPTWLSQEQARALGSSWVSRVVSSRRAMLLEIVAVRG
jgi:SAM-dependent methyltransferase